MSNNNLRPFTPQPNDSISSYLKFAGQTINQNDLIAGANVKIEQSTEGKRISVDFPILPDTMQFIGLFDNTAGYYPNQVIVVPPSSSGIIYYDEDGDRIPYVGESSSYAKSYDGAFINSGMYVCQCYIPPFSSSSDFFIDYVVPSLEDNNLTPYDQTANAYRWYDYSTYYPTTNSIVNISSSSDTTLDDSGYNIFNSIQYWVQLGSTPATSSSSSGIQYLGTYSSTTTYYNGNIVRVQSGNYQGVYICSIPYGSITNNPPIYPEPVSNGSNVGFGAGVNAWDLWTFGPNVTTNCFGGSSQVDYVNSIQQV